MIVICAPTKLRKQERISKLNKICHIDNVGLEKNITKNSRLDNEKNV